MKDLEDYMINIKEQDLKIKEYKYKCAIQIKNKE